MMSFSLIRVQLKSASEFSLGAGPVPFILHFDERQGGVSFGEVIINL